MVRIRKEYVCYLLVLMILFCFSGGTVALAQTPATEQAEEERPTLSASYTFFSQYIWRGYELSRDSLVMFPSITISYKGFGLNIWGDYDTKYEGSRGENQKEWFETDFVLTYSNSLGNLPNLSKVSDIFKNINYTIGYIYYDTDFDVNGASYIRRWKYSLKRDYNLVSGGGSTEEIYLILSYAMFGNPTISGWRQIETGEAWYVNFALSQNFALPKKVTEKLCWAQDWSYDVGGWISWMHRSAIAGERLHYSAMHDANIWAALNIPLNKYFSLSPTIQYSFPMSHAASDELEAASFDGRSDSFVYGGVVVKLAF